MNGKNGRWAQAATAAALAVATLLQGTAPAWGQAASALDAPAEETVYLINRGLTSTRNDERDRLLQALRRLRDPALAPLYRDLVQSSDSFRQAHGTLGLIECGAEPKLTAEMIGTVDDPKVQPQMVRAAIDDKLLDAAMAVQMFASPQIVLGSRLELAALLLQEGQPVDLALLQTAAEAAEGGRRQMANALLVQAGDDSALNKLGEMGMSADAKDAKDVTTCVQVLNLAGQRRFDRLGPWALEVCRQPNVDRGLMLVALETSLRLQAPQAAAFWRQEYDSDVGVAQHMRLGLVALYSSTWTEPSMFDPMISSEDELVRRMGLTGAAVAGKRNIPEAVVGLIQMNYLPANRWAIGYAKDQASDDDAQAILLALILAYQGPDQGKTERVGVAIDATRVLFDRDPEQAAPLLSAILADPATDKVLARAILLGLADSDKRGADLALAKLPDFEDRKVQSVVLIVLAKNDRPLDADQIRDLGLLVRGGGAMRDDIRLQAGWAYLKRTDQAQAALAKLAR